MSAADPCSVWSRGRVGKYAVSTPPALQCRRAIGTAARMRARQRRAGSMRGRRPDIGCRRYRGRMNARRLYIFPHAGGSAQYYGPFAKAFSSDVKCVAVQYPGRSGTHDLASFTGIPDLAEGVFDMLSPLDQSAGKIAFFGHSMGGLLAFEVARRFEAIGNPISALFVSACAAPGRSGFEHVSESDRGLLEAMSEIAGVNAKFLEDEAFAARILPTLRGLKAITKYDCPPDATISCPIFAYFGDDDEVATADKVKPWSERTTSDFIAREFAGHHFYLNDHLHAVVTDIETKL